MRILFTIKRKRPNDCKSGLIWTITQLFTKFNVFVADFVPRRGFEPPTNSLGNCCSILLSYRGIIIFNLSSIRTSDQSPSGGLLYPTELPGQIQCANLAYLSRNKKLIVHIDVKLLYPDINSLIINYYIIHLFSRIFVH